MKKWIKYIITFITVVYVHQILIVSYVRLFPYDQKAYKKSIYTVTLGVGNNADFTPVLGLVSIFTNDSCYLSIVNQAGKFEKKSYDLPTDIYSDYPEVWPEKQ